MVTLIATFLGFVVVVLLALLPALLVLAGGEYLFGQIHLGKASRFLLILIKNVRRNPLRTYLIYLATFCLVAVTIVVWSGLYILDRLTQFKARDIKMVVSEKWQAQAASTMPFSYARPLCEGAADPTRPDAVRPDDAMTWQFYVCTLDPQKRTRESIIPFIALEPRKAATLMDRIFDDVPQQSRRSTGAKLAETTQFLAAVSRMESNKRGAILGPKLLSRLGMREGDRFIATGDNYFGIDLEFEIVGTFPEGRWNGTAIMNRDYLNDALDAYNKSHRGQPHPMTNHTLSWVVLQVPDLDAYNQVAEQINSSNQFHDPAVKCETLAAFAVTQLDSYSDIVWALRWLVSPAICFTLAMIIANGISLSVAERQKEIALLKTLGYRPAQVLLLILGEGMMIGALSGCLSSLLIYQGVNWLIATTAPIFPFYIPEEALYWGPVLGALTALAGSAVPAWNGCRLEVAKTFARVG
jgi:putative ABC transport system permease protein